MNIIVPAITLTSIGIISSALNSLYMLKESLKKSNSYSGFDELKQFLYETDHETILNSSKLIINKLMPSKNENIQKIIKSLLNTIDEIEKELNDIHNRINYNNNCHLKIYPFLYKFHNAKIRLQTLTNKLNNQTEQLMKTTTFLMSLNKNPAPINNKQND